MLRRPALFALLAIMLRIAPHALAADDPARDAATDAMVAAVPPAVAACRGVALERFEQGLPVDARRHVVGAHLAPLFAQLWLQAQNKASLRAPAADAPGQPQTPVAAARHAGPPAVPDAVTVYAQGARRPLLVAYRAGRCVLAVLTLPRDRLWRVLREQLGESV